MAKARFRPRRAAAAVDSPTRSESTHRIDAEKVKLHYVCNRFFKELHPKHHLRYFPDASNGHTGPCSNLKNLQRWAGKTFRFSKSAKGDVRIVDIKTKKNRVAYRNGGH